MYYYVSWSLLSTINNSVVPLIFLSELKLENYQLILNSGAMKYITEANIDACCLPWLQNLLEKYYNHIKMLKKAALKKRQYYNF